MATLTIAERRITELQEALVVALQASPRVKAMMRDLASLDEALDKVCEAIYNATLYDPLGEREEDDDA